MKQLNVICLLLLLTFTSIFANPEKPQRVSDDSKIIGYLVLKDPSIFYAKFLKLANTIYPGSSAGIEANAAAVKNVIDSATSIAVILYSKDNFKDNPSVGIYITVKDKTVFDNPMFGMVPSKEIVDNTLIISTDGLNIDKFKEFQKNIIAIKTQKDLEFFIDIKNIVKGNEATINEKTPSSKPVLAQMEMATIKLNLTDTGIESTSCLIATDKSNLQTALTQPGVSSAELLKFTGAGNFASGIGNYDLSKAKSFVKDLLLMAINVPALSDDEKKLIKDLEPIALALCESETIQTASTMSFKNEVSAKYLLKLKDPVLFLKRMKDVYAKLSEPTFIKITDKTELKGMYEFRWEDAEKYNGLQIYKVSSVSKEKEAEITKLMSIPTSQFFAADQTYCYSGSSIEAIKELINSIKAPKNADVVLESLNFYKDGSTSYMDLYLVGYVKTLEKLVTNIFGVKLDSLLALKLPPVKIAIKLDGNISVRALIETTTIAALVQKGMELMAPPAQQNIPEDNPNSQP